MVIDERCYTILPEHIAAYVANCGRIAQPIERRYGARLLGAFTTTTATLNQYVHLWAWEDARERELVRARRDADPEWIDYAAGSRVRAVHQESRLLVPTAFSPTQMAGPVFPDHAMAFEERTYTLHPGNLAAFVETFREKAMPVYAALGFAMVGYFTVDIGTLNQVVFMNRWPSLDARQEAYRRAAACTDWQAYLAANQARIVQQESRFLVPTDYSPLH
ncbi:MAG: NIPSNAP family protein [Alphaproteobacteria bacterium]